MDTQQNSKKYHACFALEQIFVDLKGSVQACCMAQKCFASAGGGLEALFTDKRRNNAAIVDHDDASLCWDTCPVRYATATRSDPGRVEKVVVYTNTFCPLSCEYCSLTYSREAAEWTGGPRPFDGVWEGLDRNGAAVRPARVTTNNTPDLLGTLKRIVAAAENPRNILVEFTGGDSSYHPEFVAALDFLASQKIRAIYLSSGVVPTRVREDILRHVAAGSLSITISPDAINPDTWSAIKRMPERMFDQVLAFINDAAGCQMHNQIAAKFIVCKKNLVEAPVFTQFYAALGVRRFALSEYRPQPMFFVPPPTEDELRVACNDAWTIFTTADLPNDSELVVIGLDRFFNDKSWFRRSDYNMKPAWACAL